MCKEHIPLLLCKNVSFMLKLPDTAILCDPLENLLEPTIYDLPIQEGRYLFGTVATYSCGTRSAIVGGSVSTSCIGDGTSTLGSFNGTEPTCEGAEFVHNMMVSSLVVSTHRVHVF